MIALNPLTEEHDCIELLKNLSYLPGNLLTLMKQKPGLDEHPILMSDLFSFLLLGLAQTLIFVKYPHYSIIVTSNSLDTYQSGTVDFSKLSLLSWSFNLFSWCWYLLSLNISSAFCLLKEQHIPRSVGIFENMLEQLNLLPFHQHSLIIPNHVNRWWWSVISRA